MSSLIEQATQQADDGTWTFRCPVNDGTCGANGLSYATTGWPSSETAAARGDEHVAEHKEGVPMTTLEDFRAAHGLTVNPDGAAVVSAKDL